GKSYLTFAAYYYLSEIPGLRVSMFGADLKPDVIAYCEETARALDFDGLSLLCTDIRAYTPPKSPHLVISLHACDVATDIVLEKAVDWGADVILSTPCCHHELNHSIQCSPLSFVTEHSMLRQKLCDAATDALRLKLLESEGYRTEALELIDPEETPKNILLRAVRRKGFDKASEEAVALREEYLAAREFLLGKKIVF
ncbi:MAG: methyltransferase, partial [Clostridia bacterium]|nr:methyltransferase [Clostridia bacterium]